MNRLVVNIEQAGYQDRQGVVQDIRFSVQSGELVGLIGPNGAGKSTTIKAILGILRDVKADIAINGADGEGMGSYAYIPEQPILYDELTLWEHLELAASAFEMKPDVFRERAEHLLAQFRLTEVKHQLPSSFSKGMQQKLMLTIGFLHKPDLYIVDEPFVGLDPKATKDFLDMLQQERDRGAGVLMCTHVLDTAERICDSFVLLSEGRLVARGDMEAIRQQCGRPGATLFDCFHSLL